MKKPFGGNNIAPLLSKSKDKIRDSGKSSKEKIIPVSGLKGKSLITTKSPGTLAGLKGKSLGKPGFKTPTKPIIKSAANKNKFGVK